MVKNIRLYSVLVIFCHVVSTKPDDKAETGNKDGDPSGESGDRAGGAEHTTPKVQGAGQVQVAEEDALMESLKTDKGKTLIRDVALSILNIVGKKPISPETIYEPYWIGGEWVFYRTTPEMRKKKTTPRTTTTPWSSTPSTTTAYWWTTTTASTRYINYMCQHPCLELYEDFGKVCGQRYNGWNYEQKSFEDACDLYNENCINPFITPDYYDKNTWFRGHWYILHRGGCWGPFGYPPTDITELFSRVEFLMSKVDYHKDNSIFPK